MFHRVVLAGLIAMLTGCGGAATSTSASDALSEPGADTSGGTAAAGLTLTTEPTTSPAELREALARTPSRFPLAHLPAAEARSDAIRARGPEASAPLPARAWGERHVATPSVTSAPLSEYLISTFLVVDFDGNVSLPHAP